MDNKRLNDDYIEKLLMDDSELKAPDNFTPRVMEKVYEYEREKSRFKEFRNRFSIRWGVSMVAAGLIMIILSFNPFNDELYAYSKSIDIINKKVGVEVERMYYSLDQYKELIKMKFIDILDKIKNQEVD